MKQVQNTGFIKHSFDFYRNKDIIHIIVSENE